MSGDVQPRKRKDKKKKKGGESVPDRPKPDLSFLTRKLSSEDEENYTSSKSSTTSPSSHHNKQSGHSAEDVQKFHVHKDATTGGHWCAKLVFFILMAALVGLIGLIILENRGLTDLDTQQAESRYADVFQGWVEETNNHEDDHHDVHHHAHHDDDEDEEQHGNEDDYEDHHDDEDDEEEDHHSHDDDDDHHDEDEDEDDHHEEEQEDNEVSEEAEHIDDNEDENSQADNSLQDDDEQETVNEVDQEDEVSNENNEDEEEDESSEQTMKNAETEEELYVKRVVEDLKEEIIYGIKSQEEEELDNRNEEVDESGDADDNEVADIMSNEIPHVEFDNDDDAPFDEIEDDEVDSKEEQVIENDIIDEESADDKEEEEPQDEVHTSDGKESGNSAPDHVNSIYNQNSYGRYSQDFENAAALMDESPSKGLVLYNKILEAVKTEKNIAIEMKALLGRAQCLDKLAEIEKSNQILERSIDAYSKIVFDSKKDQVVDEQIFNTAASRCIDRMRFKGAYTKAVPIHEAIINRYPDDPKHQNDLAVTLLMGNRPAEALRVLHKVLQVWRNNGFALVHYGFIYKTTMNDLERGVKYLQEGIDTKDNGTMDGRFLFHLGDGLQRLGRNDEAMKVYETGVKNKIFLSRYQRSLYNIDRLVSRPWWTIEQTGYTKLFNTLTSNWKAIRDEALTVLDMQKRKSKEKLQESKSGAMYRDEAENLRDTGDWKQFELYSRGIRNHAACSLAPITCRLISGHTEASTCTRGQIKFSLMEPGTHVWPHCGPTNCRLRAHLGLKVEEKEANGACMIRVAEEKRTWKEGEVIIFDDSFEHEVWHNGTSMRLVLIVDVWHPEITLSERRSLPPI